MRMQRCSIFADCGYSAWSMKFTRRFSAITWSASGSIHVVTNVARLRVGQAVEHHLLLDQAHRFLRGHPGGGELVVGGGLEQVAVPVEALECLDLPACELGPRGPSRVSARFAVWTRCLL